MEDTRCRRGGVVAWAIAFSHLHHHVESHISKPCHAHSRETRILSPALSFLSFMNSAKSHGNESAASASVAAASTLLDFQAGRKSRGQLEYCR
jgi:hypothetical protein